MKTVAFVPIKLNSERLPMKNIKAFRNGDPLICYILNTLKKVSEIDEIYVYCSSEEIKKYLPEEVGFLKRDPYYDLPDTRFNEVLKSFAETIEADTYILTHATAPFMSAESIKKGIEMVNEKGHDSAFSVVSLRDFLWKGGEPFNYELSNIPRTQDLEILYKETCGLYIYKRNLIIEEERRIGYKPFLLEVSQIEAQDINTEEDFMIADAIYNYRTVWGSTK